MAQARSRRQSRDLQRSRRTRDRIGTREASNKAGLHQTVPISYRRRGRGWKIMRASSNRGLPLTSGARLYRFVGSIQRCCDELSDPDRYRPHYRPQNVKHIILSLRAHGSTRTCAAAADYPLTPPSPAPRVSSSASAIARPLPSVGRHPCQQPLERKGERGPARVAGESVIIGDRYS